MNQENVEVLAEMGEDKLQYFTDNSELLLIAEVDGNPAAFIICLREGIKDYESENYLWFSKNYSKFLYIDRIVIDEHYRKMGLGKMLYNEVLEHAKKTNINCVTAEIDIIPYNGASLKFRDKMGFKEVGTQFTRDGSVKVSLQEFKIQ